MVIFLFFCFVIHISISFYYNYKFTGKIFASVNIVCPKERYKRVILGEDNTRMKQICEIAATEIIRTYKMNVSLVLNVISEKKIN